MRNGELDSDLKNRFDDLKNVPERKPQAIASGKADFLRQAVSLKEDQRQIGWINKFFPTISTKERLPMLKPILVIILAIFILFGGAAGTVYAAQGSLPAQPLYQVKIWSEDLLLLMTSSAQTQLERNLNFADRRIVEIENLQAAGIPIPRQIQIRLQTQLNQALNLAAGMDDQLMLLELEHIRLRVEAQMQKMENLMEGAQNSPDPVMIMVRSFLQQQLEMAAQGETDAQGFRMQVENQIQNLIQNNQMAPSQLPGNGQGGSGYSQTITPMPSGQQNGSGSSLNDGNGPYNNYPTTTPVQGGFYGSKTPMPGNGKNP